MKSVRDTLAPFLRVLKPLCDFLQGIPRVYNLQITRELIRGCVGKPDPTILEIGCNDGTSTRWFLEIFERPEVYCFEPDPRAVARFNRKVGQHPNIHLYEIAISDRNGETTFYQSGGQRSKTETETMPEGWDLSGSIRKPKNHLVVHPWVTFDRAITVKTMTLDTWCNEHGIETIDFIWMDVQGAEMDVIRGGPDALTRTRFVYTEYSNSELYEGQATLRRLLKRLGNFKIVVRYPGDVLLRNQKSEFAPDNNTLRRLLVD